jgi:hypothetical protein
MGRNERRGEEGEGSGVGAEEDGGPENHLRAAKTPTTLSANLAPISRRAPGRHACARTGCVLPCRICDPSFGTSIETPRLVTSVPSEPKQQPNSQVKSRRNSIPQILTRVGIYRQNRHIHRLAHLEKPR